MGVQRSFIVPLMLCAIIGPASAEDNYLEHGQSYIYAYEEDMNISAVFSHSMSAGDFNADGMNEIFVAAPNLRIDGYDNSGAVYMIWGGAPDSPKSHSILLSENPVPGEFFGADTDCGDINFDGYVDFVVGTGGFGDPNADYPAYLYYGNPGNGLGYITESDLITGTNYDAFGYDVALGDLNGDSFDDIIISSLNDLFVVTPDGPSIESVTNVNIYYGSKYGVTNDPDVIHPPNGGLSTAFGRETYGHSDFNADGFDDLLVTEASGQTESGVRDRVYAYYGSPYGPVEPPQELTPDDKQGLSAGDSLTGADVNGDGYQDALLGDSGNSRAAPYAGAVYIYYGGSSGLSMDWDVVYPDWIGSHDNLGVSLSNAGDLDKDGFDDIIAGSDADVDYFDQGAAFVFFGSASGPSGRELKLVATNPSSSGFSHTSVAGVGDTNGDGWDDLLIGQDSYNSGMGRAYLFEANVTDADSDGFAARYDCDDSDSSQDILRPVYPDLDGDGYGAVGQGGELACIAPEGFVLNGLDCDDSNPDISPAEVDVCGDRIDNNCDGVGGYDGDRDYDGLPADIEVKIGTDLCDYDTDDDGLIDGEEYYTYHTDPLNADTDGDGISDGDEVDAGTDPLDGLDEVTPDTGDDADTGSDADRPGQKPGKAGCGSGAASVFVLGGLIGWRRTS